MVGHITPTVNYYNPLGFSIIFSAYIPHQGIQYTTIVYFNYTKYTITKYLMILTGVETTTKNSLIISYRYDFS